MVNVILNKNRELRIIKGHPWVYKGDIAQIKGVFADGDEAVVKNSRNKYLGKGFINQKSQIAVRLITRKKDIVDKDYFREKILTAIEYRNSFVKDTNAKRLVFSEGDFLPGLIVDYYNGNIVIQTLTLGMDKRKGIIIEVLKELLNPMAIYERNDVNVRGLEGLDQRAGLLYGGPVEEVLCEINGVKFLINIEKGQKTGFYLDQRENYNILRDLVRGKSVLDCFCYEGGFGISSACFGAESVLGIDISSNAVKNAKRNAELNNVSLKCTWEDGNVFDFIKEKSERKELFDMVILDPPSFTKGKETIPSALRGYKEINLRAIKILKEGGFLVTCSCAYHISRKLFMGIILEAANDARRTLRLIEYRTQAKDHPILPSAPETEYLKCFIFQVL